MKAMVKPPLSDSIVVVGKHVSARGGLGFYHPKPLPHRTPSPRWRMDKGTWFGFSPRPALDTAGSRGKAGTESGGRFLKAVTSPLEKSPIIV